MWEREPELASYIIAECMRSLEKVQNNFYPSGGWDEGVDYAAYMYVYLTHGLSTIKNVLGDDFGFLSAPGVADIPRFVMAAHGNCGGNNFHDASDWSLHQYGDGLSIAWSADAFNSEEYYLLRKKYLEISGLYRYPEDLIYYHPEWENDGGAELPLDSYFEGSEFFAMRSDYNKDGVYLSGHFGPESISHSHYDGGTFVLDMLGERWAIDLGKDDYSLPGYMITGTRDTYYRIRPEGHNTFVINPEYGMGHERNVTSPIYKYETSENGALAAGDMTSVYANSLSAKRGFMLTDNRQSVIIRDEIRTQKASEVYWFMHTPAEIKIVDKNTALLTQNGKQVKLSFITNAQNAEIISMPAALLATSPNPAGQNKNEGVSKVAIHIPSASDINLTVKITAADGVYAETAIADVPLDKWTLSEN